MDSKSNRLVAGSGVDSSRHTSFRRHGGGGFGGHDIDKEVIHKNIIILIGTEKFDVIETYYNNKWIKMITDFSNKVRKRDRAYTRASVVMVVCFVVAHMPRFVANILELIYTLDFPKVSL